MMTLRRLRWARLVAAGAFLSQIGACTFSEINELVQTVLLGITAAGGVAIIQNI